MKQTAILTFILVIGLTGCGQTNTSGEKQDQQPDSISIDTSVIAVLTLDTNYYWVFKDKKPTDLTRDDLVKIESVLNTCINDYNPSQEQRFIEINEKYPEYKRDKKHFVIDLSRYKRQYVAALNSKGEKEVWLNCFCKAGDKDWRKDLIIVKDGGNCYFSLKINLTSGQYFELRVNGDA